MVLKTFIKPFEAPQRSVKTNTKFISISIQLAEMHGVERVKTIFGFGFLTAFLCCVTFFIG